MRHPRWLLALDVARGVALLVLIVLVAVVFVKLSDTNARIGARQHGTQKSAKQSCTIQARGLAAQRYLTGSLDDIHALLTLPPSRAARRQQAQTPRWLLRRELAIVRSLNRNLAGYVRITRQQPHTRTC